MNEESCLELPEPNAELLDVGIILGQNYAFSLVAGRCSAAAAEGLRRLRQQQLFKACTEKWEDFCPRYLKMSRAEADRIIRLLDEFGPAYFELSQLTRVSAETFRAIAPHIENGVLHHNGEAIELNAGNSRRVAAAVAEMRCAIPPKNSALSDLPRELKDIRHQKDVHDRIRKLARCCYVIVAEFEKISRDGRLGGARVHLEQTLTRVRDEMARLLSASSDGMSPVKTVPGPGCQEASGPSRPLVGV